MNPVILIDSRGKKYTLTVDHASSRDGVPVLVDEDGAAYGPAENIRDGRGDLRLVCKFIDQLYLADMTQRNSELIQRWNAAAAAMGL